MTATTTQKSRIIRDDCLLLPGLLFNTKYVSILNYRSNMVVIFHYCSIWKILLCRKGWVWQLKNTFLCICQVIQPFHECVNHDVCGNDSTAIFTSAAPHSNLSKNSSRENDMLQTDLASKLRSLLMMKGWSHCMELDLELNLQFTPFICYFCFVVINTVHFSAVPNT